MKQHLVIKLHAPLEYPQIPYWGDFVLDKNIEIDRFSNSLDVVFAQNDAGAFWITQEYRPSLPHGQYSEDEQATGLNRIYRIILRERMQLPAKLVEQVRLTPIVEEVRAALVGQSPVPSSSFGFHPLADRAHQQIHLKYAHQHTRGVPQIKIAVLDTGADLLHPELAERIARKADFVNLEGLDTTDFVGDKLGFDEIPEDEVGHGTHVAGIIIGRGLQMPLGVAPNCELLVVRVLASLRQGNKVVGAGLIDNINTGIKWAVDQGADVINMSLGIRHQHGGLPHDEVIRYALKKGTTVVAAAGNDGTRDKYYPGALPGVIAVGAVDEQDRIAPFSTYGAHISVVAPGNRIYSSYVGQSYAFSSGTSQAAPFVSGGVALLKSWAREKGFSLRDHQVKYLLKHTSDKPGRSFRSEKAGYGRLNLQDAMKLLRYLIS